MAPWQKLMVDEVVQHEMIYVAPTGILSYPHLIAVQPFTTTGATPYLPGGTVQNVTVLNGHYTTVANAAMGTGALGAITMARMYAGKADVVIGSNEGKISGRTTIFPWGGSGESCGWEDPARDYVTGVPTQSAGVDCFGETEGARAEAWEFMLDGGGVFDHFGYYWNSSFGADRTSRSASLHRVSITVLTGLIPPLA